MSPAAITRAVQSGRLYRRYQGVYSLMRTLTREGEWLAAVYAMGDGAALAALNAAVVPPEQVANVIHDAAYRRLFSPARARERGNPRLNRAIDMYLAGSAGTKSDLEDRFMALVREGRFPEPVINTHILGIEVDFRWGDYCVAVDGPNHNRAPTRARDEADQATLEAHGLTVVRFTEAAIDFEPRLVLRELAARGLARRQPARTR
jgi:very-short-patch-repair endonuclease